MGFCRQEDWSGLPFPTPEDLPNPGIEPTSLASPVLAGGTRVPPGKPPWILSRSKGPTGRETLGDTEYHWGLHGPSPLGYGRPLASGPLVGLRNSWWPGTLHPESGCVHWQPAFREYLRKALPLGSVLPITTETHQPPASTQSRWTIACLLCSAPRGPAGSPHLLWGHLVSPEIRLLQKKEEGPLLRRKENDKPGFCSK